VVRVGNGPTDRMEEWSARGKRRQAVALRKDKPKMNESEAVFGDDLIGFFVDEGKGGAL
jgi:hypothetical protein